jgi:hypothetical protein
MTTTMPPAAQNRRSQRSNSTSSSVVTVRKSLSLSSKQNPRASHLRAAHSISPDRSTSPNDYLAPIYPYNLRRGSAEDTKSTQNRNINRWSHSTSSSVSAVDTDALRRGLPDGSRRISVTHDYGSPGKRPTASPQKNHRSQKSSTDGLNTAFLAPINGSPRSTRSPNGTGPTLTPTSVYNTKSGDYFGETWHSRKASSTKFGEPVTAMSIQYVTNGAQKPRRVDHVPEERTSPRPPQKSVSKPELRSQPADEAATTPMEPKKSRGHRSPTQKSMLSKALSMANTAVLLDNSSKIDGAIEAYHEACELLQQVMVRSSDMEDRKKLSAIRKTYSNRIAELHDLDDPFSSLVNKDLPDDPPSEGVGQTFFGNASGPSTVEALEQVHIPPRGESLLPSIFGGDRYLDDSRNPVPRPRPSNLELPMETRYMPPPLSPRRPLSPGAAGEPPQQPPPEVPNEPPSLPRPIRRASTESTSWLDTIDDGDSLHSSSFKSRLSRLSTMGLQLTNNDLANEIEAEFDAALNAAVDAAYDSEELVSNEETPRIRQNGQLFSPGLPLQATNIENQSSLERPRADSDLEASHSYSDEDTTEEEERLLDEMTSGYVFDDFGFDKKSKSALPRQSDSSNFSGRTLSSSNQSTTLTAATNLSTLAEAVEPAKPAAFKDAPLPLPPPSTEAMSPPKPTLSLQTSPRRAERLSAVNLRDRRISGQHALKIETYAPARGTDQSKPNAPPRIEIPSQPDMQKPLPAPGPPSTGTLPITPLASIHSNESQNSESPATPALTQAGSRNSMDEIAPPPSSPAKLTKMMPPPTTMRKNLSSTSLRQKNLSISGSVDEQSPMTPGSAIGPGGGVLVDRKNIPPLPTPTTATFTHQASFSGGMHLFDDHVGVAASPKTPRSPTAASAIEPPVPLEACPESFLLRPWWLMRCLYQVVAHPRGGHLTNKLFLPRDIWKVKNVKLRFLEDKISQCDILTAALLGLAKVDSNDATAMLVAMQSFENELERVRTGLQKKMGNEVGLSNSTNVFKSPTDDGDPMSAKTPNGSSAARSFASGWKKLRSKSSNAAITNASAASSKDPALVAALTMPSLPMTSSSSVQTSSRGNNHRHKIPPPSPTQLANIPVMHATYMSSLARLFDAVQILDAIARQVEDPGLKATDPTQVGLELSVRCAAEFFAFFIIRFVMADISILVDKFLKRGAEWVLA